MPFPRGAASSFLRTSSPAQLAAGALISKKPSETGEGTPAPQALSRCEAERPEVRQFSTLEREEAGTLVPASAHDSQSQASVKYPALPRPNTLAQNF